MLPGATFYAMKLKAFNSETCVSVRTRTTKASIGINTKTGFCRINKIFCEKVGIKNGDKISFHQDEEAKEDWFLLVNDPMGFEVRERKTISGGLVFGNTTLVRKITESVAFEGLSGQVLLASEPIIEDEKKYWPLITASLK